MKKFFLKTKEYLSGLSFRTGLTLLCICIACYFISFAQALLPISLAWKGGLWVAFFGLAKTFQYTAILIIGKEGIRKLMKRWKKSSTTQSNNTI